MSRRFSPYLNLLRLLAALAVMAEHTLGYIFGQQDRLKFWLSRRLPSVGRLARAS